MFCAIKHNTQNPQIMKTARLLLAIALFAISASVQAQISIKVTIGNPPAWGPAESVGVRFYYLPDVEAYYDVGTSMFIYRSNGVWVKAASLPASCGTFDLYTGYKVVLKDYKGDSPYDNFEEHKKNYPHGYGKGREQKTYGTRPGNGYGDKNHQHTGSGGGDHGNGHGHGHGNGHGNDND